jgi:creatinine amidohydrolase
MTTKHRLAEMAWPEVRDAAAAGRVVLQPTAAIEQHGPHLPVDTDNLVVTELCEAAATRHPDEFIVSPCVPFGFNDHNMEFPGTISISPETLLAFYVDLGKSLVTNGFSRIRGSTATVRTTRSSSSRRGGSTTRRRLGPP